mgnify:CR=1 FL=1
MGKAVKLRSKEYLYSGHVSMKVLVCDALFLNIFHIRLIWHKGLELVCLKSDENFQVFLITQ